MYRLLLAVCFVVSVFVRPSTSSSDCAPVKDYHPQYFGAFPFSLPPLPFPEASLAPFIGAETVQYHYGKHHAAYIKNLNDIVANSPADSYLRNSSLQQIIASAPLGKPLFNNAAQAYNHMFYWDSLKAAASYIEEEENLPSEDSALSNWISRDFGSFAAFKVNFTAAAVSHFGSGWAWLVVGVDQSKLLILATNDANTPSREGANYVPLMTCDVWEHSYYIDQRNLRASYVENWWKLVNWQFAEDNLQAVVNVNAQTEEPSVG